MGSDTVALSPSAESMSLMRLVGAHHLGDRRRVRPRPGMRGPGRRRGGRTRRSSRRAPAPPPPATPPRPPPSTAHRPRVPVGSANSLVRHRPGADRRAAARMPTSSTCSVIGKRSKRPERRHGPPGVEGHPQVPGERCRIAGHVGHPAGRRFAAPPARPSPPRPAPSRAGSSTTRSGAPRPSLTEAASTSDRTISTWLRPSALRRRRRRPGRSAPRPPPNPRVRRLGPGAR